MYDPRTCSFKMTQKMPTKFAKWKWINFVKGVVIIIIHVMLLLELKKKKTTYKKEFVETHFQKEQANNMIKYF